MYSVYSKSVLALGIAGMLALGACGNSDEQKARAYLDAATEQMNSNDFTAALASLDSLDKLFPAEVKVRREGMSLRPEIIERQSLKELEHCDSVIASLIIESERLKGELTHVPDAFDGYYTTKALAGKIPADKSGLYARMTPEGVYTVVASSTQKALSTGVTLMASGASVTTPDVAHDGERNDRSRGVEIITFMPAECDTLGVFANAHAADAMKVRFNGAKPYEIPLPADQAKALGQVYTASRIFTQLRVARLEKSRLEKQLDIARNQRARTFKESEN